MTRFGAGAVVMGLGLLVLGVVLHWPEVALLGAGLTATVIVATAMVLWRPSLVVGRSISPPQVPRGSWAIAHLDFSNRGLLPSPTTRVEQPYSGTDEPVSTILPRLAPGQGGVLTVKLPTSRRGIHQLEPVEVIREDPFRLYRLIRHHGHVDEIWVTPKVLPLRPLPSGITPNIEGPSSDTSPRGTITFHQLREYVPGDDLRMIHWLATARVGKPMVRQNVDTSQPFTVVVLDNRPEPYGATPGDPPPESFELAVDAAASILSCGAIGGFPVQLRTATGAQIGGTGLSTELAETLAHLVSVAPQPGDLEAALRLLGRERGGTALVVVTGRIGAGELPAASALRRRFDRVLVVSLTEAAEPTPAAPGISVVNASTEAEFAAAWALAIR